jgi:hypothetical protein
LFIVAGVELCMSKMLPEEGVPADQFAALFQSPPVAGPAQASMFA